MSVAESLPERSTLRSSPLRLLKSPSSNICECDWSLPKWSTLNVGLLAVLTNIKMVIMLTGTNTLAYLSPLSVAKNFLIIEIPSADIAIHSSSP